MLAENSSVIGKTLNIGSNTEVSIRDLFELIKELMQSDIKSNFDKQRKRPNKSEVFRLCCDNKRIEELIGFKSQINIRDGLKKTIDWLTKPENLKVYKTEIYNV